MEEEHNTVNILVIWRGKKLNVEMSSGATLKELGNKLLKLTNIKFDTMRLLVPKSSDESSKLLTPFSDEHSGLSLQETSILEGKSIRMMGVFEDEIEEVSQSGIKTDLRIAGFEEEDKRLRQRMLNRPQTSLKLPQGAYIFCDFRTLHITGIELNPPASEALRRMHMLAADPGIVAIMNKHRWRVGIMTEMAPVGYVGVSPKCILGYNKNHGEEISLRLRTDDLKGFRKYESIKKTLLHELAHMVYSEHDANFYALDKQLNQEASSLDWTRSKSHTLSGLSYSDRYEEEYYAGTGNSSSSQKLGGKTSDQLASARASSVSAAYHRLANVSTNSSEGSEVRVEPDPDDSGLKVHVEPDPDDSIGGEAMETEPCSGINGNGITSESDPNDCEMLQFVPHLRNNGRFIGPEACAEPDPDDSADSKVSLNNGVVAEPDPDDSLVIETVDDETQLRKAHEESDMDYSNIKEAILEYRSSVEPDPDDSQAIESGEDATKVRKALAEPDPDDFELKRAILEYGNSAEPDPDDSLANGIIQATPDPDDNNEGSMETSSMQADEPDPDDQELQRIQDPVAAVCTRLQKAIEMLRSEVNPTEATSVLQTLFKIIKNVIENPDNIKFRRLRKANPLFQRNVANYKAAMEILFLIGFNEDIVSDEIGRAETYVVLKRNDPGLLWLAKSSLEMCIAY